MYSNLRLLDSINRPKDLIDTAINLGLSGIAITDHECLSAHMEVNQYAKELQKTHPNFTIALGNEIYLVDERKHNQQYYHFLLLAKDELGHKALRELSSKAWYNSYADKGMERVPTTKEELSNVVNKYKGHLIATTACIGGELSSNVYLLANATENTQYYHNKIKDFIEYCLDLFGNDFYIECAPSTADDQMIVNNKLYNIATELGVKMTVGTDAHYLRPKDRPIHKAYLNSKGGEREVDSFYEFTYVMSPQEVSDLLKPCFVNLDKTPEQIVNWIFDNSHEIESKISWYSLERKQIIPKVQVKDYPIALNDILKEKQDKIPVFCNLMLSNNIQERCWANECYISLSKKIYNKQISEQKFDEYLKRLEIEADIIKDISNKLEDCLFAYFNTFKHYIDLFWECGSIVGPGRGSATGFLSNYLLGITQLDPVRWNLPYWRLT
jgi:DNA polymerase-3 subunit alpha